ncbi:MAG: YceI family protein [Sphingobacteriaceae bacterium]
MLYTQKFSSKLNTWVISTVTDSFKSFNGEDTTTGVGFENATIDFSMAVKSIDTNQEQRDEHLKSADFFESDTYPQITFHSMSFTKLADDDYELTENLTMKGITKPVTLKAAYGRSATDGYGNRKHGFEVTGKVNRKELDITYNALMEGGGLTLGEDFKLIANVQLAEQA